MTNLQIKQLYYHKRGPENGFNVFCLFLYAPFGIILFALRLIIALFVLILGYLLPNSEVTHNLLFKLINLSLGISVTVKNANKKEDVEVYVSNCLSHFDHLAIHAVTGAVTPGAKMNPVLSRAFGTYDFGNFSNFDMFKTNVSLLISEGKTPVYFRPEAKITNGRALLKFKSYPFSFIGRIQPICIYINRPFFNIPVVTLGSSYWTNIFFFMISPCTIYNLEFLPPLEKKNLQDDEFAEIVRQNIGSASKVELSEFGSSDLAEWEKRYFAEQQTIRNNHHRPQGTTSLYNFPDVLQMTMQVREVLPHVPQEIVYRDLLKTRNVDHTISNILEGHVRFVPEMLSTPSASTPSTSGHSATKASDSSPPTNTAHLNTAVSNFGKSAHERSLSFQERKKQLIENARKRYIEKHNLNMALNNC